jgi:triacylglycerol lipase
VLDLKGEFPMPELEFESRAREYSAANAYALAEMADLAYERPAVIKRKLKTLGFLGDDLEVFPARPGDTQVFVVSNDEVILVAFRGTEPEINQWLGDLRYHLTGGPLGKVHEGFAAALSVVWLDVLQALRDRQESRQGSLSLWFTGHSFGGALATLAVAKMIERAEPVDGLYTYGCPRCGDQTFATAFNANFSRAFRVVNRNDLVTRAPPRPFYQHVGTVKYIDENGILRGEEDGWIPFLRSVKYTLDDLRNMDLGAIESHQLDNYLKALDKLRRPTQGGAA